MIRSIVYILSLSCLLFTTTAHAKLGDSTSTPEPSSGYVEAAKQAAISAVNSFNAQDNIASKNAGDSLKAGVYVNASVAIQQFQRQFDAANKMVSELNAALSGCLAAADAEIAAAQAELAAAQAAAAACSESSDSDDGSSSSDSSCADAAAAAAAAAQAKIDKAVANKEACRSNIGPKIAAGTQAATDVANAARESGFSLQASAGIGGSNGTITAKPGVTVDPNKTVYVPPVKAIDVTSLQFWVTGPNAYPGSSPSVNDLIAKLPRTTPSVTDTGVREAGLVKWIITGGRVAFTVWGLSNAPSDAMLNNSYMQLRAMERPAIETLGVLPSFDSE
jgi:hypothetical protein